MLLVSALWTGNKDWSAEVDRGILEHRLVSSTESMLYQGR